MKEIVYVMLLIGLLSIYSCSDVTSCTPIEREIMRSCEQADSVYSIELSSMTQFDWDTLYVIVGPRFPEEVQELIGLRYNQVIQDDCSQYIFILKGKVINEFTSSCINRRVLLGDTDGSGYAKYSSHSIVEVEKVINGGVEYYKLLGVK